MILPEASLRHSAHSGFVSLHASRAPIALHAENNCSVCMLTTLKSDMRECALRMQLNLRECLLDQGD